MHRRSRSQGEREQHSQSLGDPERLRLEQYLIEPIVGCIDDGGGVKSVPSE
jgi:hypothetical protein